ncbi:hypothetical protein DL766_004875 [Monosporascus sp. MC13-8B]|uniref:CS domain-containing protein n=1 Tax=Monosporascus cannonballus TaxID=155416 RepID=A0ABY0GQJ1_9PEZI|nr:hypothetical protein DL762_010397 [Monosporascus cannonballus]RYO99533.1 hypothetical protein DL763_001444 [Monosporascus cannonballus]RYP30425.1 hypothetical protein DL766_004875 [Monosporascus sp. MC13-8B]
MPSATVLADRGVKAVSAGKYKEGIEKLTEALKEKPAPLWLLERSKAYVRTGDIDRALHDAERALRVAFDRANRDMMVEAQIRRAVTYFRLKRYADADICAFWAMRLCEGARASEDDGQAARIDGNGDYAVTLEEVKAANARPASNAQDGLSAAMGGSSGRTKEAQLNNEAFTWRLQALTKLEQLPPGDPGRKVGITEKYPNRPEELPDKKTEEKPAAVETSEDENNAPEEKNAGQGASAPKNDETSKKQAWEKLWNDFSTLHAKNNIRSSYYQTDTTLNVDLFVKNVPRDEFNVDAQNDSVTLGPIPNTRTGRVQLFLYDRIKPEETKHTVKSMKIELILKKETPGKWPTLRKQNSEVFDNLALASSPATTFSHFYNFVTGLGYESPEDLQLKGVGSDETSWYEDLLEKLRIGLKSLAVTKDKLAPSISEITSSTITAAHPSGDAMQVDSPVKATAAAAPPPDNANKPKPAAATSSGPAYPTSSKKGPKNWDKIDDEDDAEKDGDGDVNSFFQTIYKNADDDTRRAMMKSYIESNGTSLSTSWAEAKDKKYETLPPDGSEAKKW